MLRGILSKIALRLTLNIPPYVSFMHKHQCIFIHLPKNAGTSVMKAFGYQGSRYHAKWKEFRRLNPKRFEQYHKFAIVREPHHRLRSAYRYLLAGGNQSVEDIALGEMIAKNTTSFEDFVLNFLTPDLVYRTPVLEPQYLYIFDTQDQCQVDTILRYEQLNTDWQLLMDKLDCNISLPWINKSKSDEGTIGTEEVAECLAKVRAIYQQDYRLLGYE